MVVETQSEEMIDEPTTSVRIDAATDEMVDQLLQSLSEKLQTPVAKGLMQPPEENRRFHQAMEKQLETAISTPLSNAIECGGGSLDSIFE